MLTRPRVNCGKFAEDCKNQKHRIIARINTQRGYTNELIEMKTVYTRLVQDQARPNSQNRGKRLAQVPFLAEELLVIKKNENTK